MNSAVHHSLSPLQLQVAPVTRSSASRVHVSLTYGSLNVSQSSKRSLLVSSPLQMSCKLHAFSEWSNMNGEERGKNNFVRGAGGAPLSMAGVLGPFSPNGKMMNPKPIMACPGQYPHNAEGSVMGALHEMMTNPNTFFFFREPDSNRIEALKFYAMALSTKDPKGAEEIMRNACRDWAGRQVEGDLLMAFIELLLSQEKYEEANEVTVKLSEVVGKQEDEESESPFLALKQKKVYLYKAIIKSVQAAQLKQNQTEAKDSKSSNDQDWQAVMAAAGECWDKYCAKTEQVEDLPRPENK